MTVSSSAAAIPSAISMFPHHMNGCAVDSCCELEKWLVLTRVGRCILFGATGFGLEASKPAALEWPIPRTAEAAVATWLREGLGWFLVYSPFVCGCFVCVCFVYGCFVYGCFVYIPLVRSFFPCILL
jgi:hypothetical protein